MKEIERIMDRFVGAICSYHEDDVEFCENVLKDSNNTQEAIEQYIEKEMERALDVNFEFWKNQVIKARIETAQSIRQQELYGGFCIDEYIAQLKKGLK